MKQKILTGFDLNAEECLGWSWRYSAAELGQILVRIRQALDEGDVTYLRSFPFVGRLYGQRRKRAGITPAIRRRVKAKTGGRCAHCRSLRYVEIDHIVPVCLGGGDDESNLQALCRTCNRAKGPQSWTVRGRQ